MQLYTCFTVCFTACFTPRAPGAGRSRHSHAAKKSRVPTLSRARVMCGARHADRGLQSVKRARGWGRHSAGSVGFKLDRSLPSTGAKCRHLYSEKTKLKNGLTVWRCVRGTSQLEGFHGHLRRWLRAGIMSPVLLHALLQDAIQLWNYNRGEVVQALPYLPCIESTHFQILIVERIEVFLRLHPYITASRIGRRQISTSWTFLFSRTSTILRHRSTWTSHTTWWKVGGALCDNN